MGREKAVVVSRPYAGFVGRGSWVSGAAAPPCLLDGGQSGATEEVSHYVTVFGGTGGAKPWPASLFCT
jgi:hypothetical protein